MTVINAFITYLTTITRLLGFGSAEGFQYVNIQPFALTSLSRIYESKEISDKVYELTKGAFDKGLIINRFSYQDSALYYLDKAIADSRTDVGEESYARVV